MRYESEAEAIERSSLTPYFCVWCNGYHTTGHGPGQGLKGKRGHRKSFKGSRRGR